MTTSLSAVLRDPAGPYSLETLELDEPGPSEALVRVVASGLCHTDLMGRAGVLGEHFLPAVLGHEGSGVVEKVGPGVTDFAPGDHVVLSFDSCGTCPGCLAGRPTDCTGFEARNLSGLTADGRRTARDARGEPVTNRWFGQSSFARYSLTTVRNMVKVEQDLPLELLGPLGCSIQTGAGSVLNAMRLAPGQSLAVFGAGAVGLSAIMAARLSGASDIVAVDLNPARRDLALKLGATRAVDGGDADVVGAVTGGGGGLDFSFDTTGVSAVMANAVRVLNRPGTCILVGAGMDMLTLHPAELTGKTVTYLYEGGAVPQLFIPRLIELWRQGVFPFEELITRYRLDEIDRAEADAIAGTAVKPVLVMP
ncbi:aryl-alcohol dehydrogenase [Actinocorallia herbida]|uniref:Aryl-alcohol dehydrogenase n=1 Tax=Actinocorallia herbida TaxID=58109 RepID=A0A3N1D173_9ACTN|nr:NAD(P)-dependent alcohol dehydrogenase [Actinocorallia herbida]ROO87275.1 aryl-alcohol dehydrogenase [Actinocorallia herbida]